MTQLNRRSFLGSTLLGSLLGWLPFGKIIQQEPIESERWWTDEWIGEPDKVNLLRFWNATHCVLPDGSFIDRFKCDYISGDDCDLLIRLRWHERPASGFELHGIPGFDGSGNLVSRHPVYPHIDYFPQDMLV